MILFKFLVLFYKKIRFRKFLRFYRDSVKTTLFLEKNPRDVISFTEYLSREFKNNAERKN